MTDTPAEKRLRSEARERWGDEWFLETVEHADGSKSAVAQHSERIVADGVVIREQLRWDGDGGFRSRRVLIDTTECIAEVPDGVEGAAGSW